MKRIFLIFFVIIIAKTSIGQYLDYEDLASISYKTFSKDELKKNNFNKVTIFAKYFDYNFLSDWEDTIYIAIFDKNYDILEERYFDGSDSTIIKYFYSENKKLDKVYKRIFSDKYISEDNCSYYNSFGKMDSIISLRHSNEYYIYDSKHRLIEKNKSKRYRFYYNSYDSLIREVKLYPLEYSVGFDSIVITKKYNNNNLLVEFKQEPSPTFCKNFTMTCDADPLDKLRIIQYDTLNRIIYEKRLRNIEYRTTYYDFGYTTIRYEDNIPVFLGYYSVFFLKNKKTEIYASDYDWDLQGFTNKIRNTIYMDSCEQDNCLPKRIDLIKMERLSFDCYPYTTFIFKYN